MIPVTTGSYIDQLYNLSIIIWKWHDIQYKANIEILQTGTVFFLSVIFHFYRVRVEFFTNEKSLKERLQLYFIKNQRSSKLIVPLQLNPCNPTPWLSSALVIWHWINQSVSLTLVDKKLCVIWLLHKHTNFDFALSCISCTLQNLEQKL